MADQTPENAANVYEFTVKNLDGEDVPMSNYQGKVLLIVNTAANCGLAKSNIKSLNELYEKFKDRDVKILGFPSNDFYQESACDIDIKDYVAKNNIQFDYFAKIHVNGNETEPLYRYLKHKQSSIFGKAIKWNFSKFLVDKNGIPVNRYAPTTSPSSIVKDIENLLN